MGKKEKKVRDKQKAKIKALRVQSSPKKEEKDITYICTVCGEKEKIPKDVVECFDIFDDGDINEPPTFSCEKCGGIMRPKYYEGVHGITYEF